jgi:AraC-like DNA-binding protein
VSRHAGTRDGVVLQRFVRDLQVLAGHVPPFDPTSAEQLLLRAVRNLELPLSPAACWTVRGLTVVALQRVAGNRTCLLDDWHARVQRVWHLASLEDLEEAVSLVIAALRACPSPAPLRNSRTATALAYMREHFHDQNFSLDIVSARVRLSRWHVGRLLHRETGATYRELLRQMRLERALTLLRDPTRTVKEVAAAVGYRYNTELDRDFKRVFGVSPTVWRRTNGRSPEAVATRLPHSDDPVAIAKRV